MRSVLSWSQCVVVPRRGPESGEAPLVEAAATARSEVAVEAAPLHDASPTAVLPGCQAARRARFEAPPDGWYACCTRPRAEKQVDRLLEERGIESYLPAVARVHRWRDRDQTVIVPLFTSYVFARGQVLWRIVETPGVYDVVRFDDHPALIPDADIRNIERFVRALTVTRHEPAPVPFRQGERVRITCGPLRGVEGVVVQMKNQRRVIVGLAAIDAGFEVNVPARSLSIHA